MRISNNSQYLNLIANYDRQELKPRPCFYTYRANIDDWVFGHTSQEHSKHSD
ncbi:MAG: hypothetical protein ACOYN8_13740 [Pseudanabaena sp.]